MLENFLTLWANGLLNLKHMLLVCQKGIFSEMKNLQLLKKLQKWLLSLLEKNNAKTILKSSFPIQEKEIIDISVMDMEKFKTFIKNEIEDAREKQVLFSVHMKATMMKVSDPLCLVPLFQFFTMIFLKNLSLSLKK